MQKSEKEHAKIKHICFINISSIIVIFDCTNDAATSIRS